MKVSLGVEQEQHTATKAKGFPRMNAFLEIVSTLGFQPAANMSRIITDILEMRNLEAKADTILATTAHFGELDQICRSRLLDGAIEMFGEEGPHDTFRRYCAAYAIAQSLRYLEPKHVSTIDVITARRLELSSLLSDCIGCE